MINVRYHVDDLLKNEFLRELQLLGVARRRDGASFWQVFEDAREPGLFVETYVVATWLDHLRQHERISRQDAAIQLRLRQLVRPGTAPVVTHYISPV